MSDNESKPHENIYFALARLSSNEDFQVLRGLIEEYVKDFSESLKITSHENEHYDVHKEAARTAFLRGRINALENVLDVVSKANESLARLKKSA